VLQQQLRGVHHMGSQSSHSFQTNIPDIRLFYSNKSSDQLRTLVPQINRNLAFIVDDQIHGLEKDPMVTVIFINALCDIRAGNYFIQTLE
jgi:hypothetical protein